MCRNCYRDKSTELQGNETDSEINAEDYKSDKIQTKYRRNFFYNYMTKEHLRQNPRPRNPVNL